jgi:thiol-disulfide isomerase/thioredoxin
MGFKALDMFKKIPADLSESTTMGAIMSVAAAVFMGLMFCVELWAFLQNETETGVVLDTNQDPYLRINFNLTMLDLPCDFAAVDVVDVIGTNRMNITKNVDKWSVDADGRRSMYKGRNKEARAIKHDDHHDLDELHANGVHAAPLNDADFADSIRAVPAALVNFYAPWCIWCQRFEPTYEALAETVEAFNREAVDEDGGQGEHAPLPVSIFKVDCPANQAVCGQQQVRAFPTVRLYKDGAPAGADYKEDRTVTALMNFLKVRVQFDEMNKGWHPSHRDQPEHPGCMLSGFVDVNRVPGNFHVEARSPHHEINAAMANLSHVVNHLSFGTKTPWAVKRKIASRYPQFAADAPPLDGNTYATETPHETVHHYLKVVTTHFDVGTLLQSLSRAVAGSRNVVAGTPASTVVGYKVVAQSQVMKYHELDVPEAKFSYDLSPMAVSVSSKGKHWYDFLTSCCAIIGGTFTVLGLLDGALYKILKGGKQL